MNATDDLQSIPDEVLETETARRQAIRDKHTDKAQREVYCLLVRHLDLLLEAAPAHGKDCTHNSDMMSHNNYHKCMRCSLIMMRANSTGAAFVAEIRITPTPR